MMRAGTLLAWLMAILLVGATFATGRVQGQDKGGQPDAVITKQIERALAKDPALKDMDIKVETQEGVVNLTGFVRSVDDIARAAELARSVSGVSSVRNGLRVVNRPSQA
jgi:hyperosmotically inducible periplasmic protein